MQAMLLFVGDVYLPFASSNSHATEKSDESDRRWLSIQQAHLVRSKKRIETLEIMFAHALPDTVLIELVPIHIASSSRTITNMRMGTPVAAVHRLD